MLFYIWDATPQGTKLVEVERNCIRKWIEGNQNYSEKMAVKPANEHNIKHIHKLSNIYAHTNKYIHIQNLIYIDYSSPYKFSLWM